MILLIYLNFRSILLIYNETVLLEKKKKRKPKCEDVLDEIKNTTTEEQFQIIAHFLFENNRLNNLIKDAKNEAIDSAKISALIISM